MLTYLHFLVHLQESVPTTFIFFKDLCVCVCVYVDMCLSTKSPSNPLELEIIHFNPPIVGPGVQTLVLW